MRLSCVSDIKYIRPRNVRIIGGTVVVLAIWNQMSTNLCTSDGIQQEKAFTQYTQTHTHKRIRSFLLCLIKRARLSTPQMKKYTQTLFILHTYLIYTYLFVRYAVDILTPAQSDACTREYVRSSLFRKRAQGKFSSTRCLRPRTRQVDRNIVIGEKKKIDGKKHTHQQL